MVVLAVSCCSLHFNKSQTDSQYILLVCGAHGSRGSRATFYLLQPWYRGDDSRRHTSLSPDVGNHRVAVPIVAPTI